uniref:Secreted protein n=1 Tax=Steinernema glaseri TaxID=37863 RepID=A0A1I7Z2W5_9BILA
MLVLVLLPVLFDIIPLCIVAGCIYLKSRCIYLSFELADFLPFVDFILSYLATSSSLHTENLSDRCSRRAMSHPP